MGINVLLEYRTNTWIMDEAYSTHEKKVSTFSPLNHLLVVSVQNVATGLFTSIAHVNDIQLKYV